jgi:hypothetical protein
LPSLTRKQKTRGEQPSGSALADGDIAPVNLTSTDYARMADLVNLYKSLRWEPLMPRISLSPNRSGLTDVGRWTAVTPRWSGRARGCADPSALKSVNDSALRSCVARQTEHCYWFEQFQIAEYLVAGWIFVDRARLLISFVLGGVQL